MLKNKICNMYLILLEAINPASTTADHHAIKKKNKTTENMFPESLRLLVTIL